MLTFLTSLGSRWNIGMFHYRNHGAAFGKVLLGIQMPKPERKYFLRSLDDLGFEYREETKNPDYKLFVGGYE